MGRPSSRGSGRGGPRPDRAGNATPPAKTQIEFRGPPGAPPPSKEQVEMMQRRLEDEARKRGMSLQQYLEHMSRTHQNRGGDVTTGIPILGPESPVTPASPASRLLPDSRAQNPGPPKPEALALAKFLKSQPLKPRTVILNGERREMFRVKRAIRALMSPAYAAARAKNPILPEASGPMGIENAFKLLPMSLLALRVEKIADKHSGESGRGKGKRIKGQWNVRIVEHQESDDNMYYVWLWEGSQVMRKVYAALALVALFIIVLYPLWPLFLRQAVYYLSWVMLAVLGLFFVMAIFRVILFCVTYFAVPPGFWLYPNLWEDVSFMDSFRPVWAWHESKKKKKSSSRGSAEASNTFSAATGQPTPASAITTATGTRINTGEDPSHRNAYIAPQVEDLSDDDDDE